MKKFSKNKNNYNDNKPCYSLVNVEGKLVPTSTCTDIVKECPLSISEGEKKKNKKERLLEWYEKHKLICNIVAWAVVIAIIIFAIVFAVHSCNNSNPSSNVETTVSTSSSSIQVTTVAATTKPQATESTTVQPTTSKPKKENSVTTNNNNNNNNNSNNNSSSGNSNSNELGKGGGNSSYSNEKTVSNYDTHEKDKDMSSDRDSKKDEGITGGNKGYGASISSKKESPSPEKKFEEEHTLPPTISQDEINQSPTVPLTPRTATADNQAE